MYHSAIGAGNFVPLFQRVVQNESEIFFRDIVTRRASLDDRRKIMPPIENDEWDEIDRQFDDAGPSKNMYVFTKAFSSTTRFLHVGPFSHETSNLLANVYGNVETGNQSWWSMQSASSTHVNKETKFKDWLDASSLGDDRISLVARQSIGSQQYAARHTRLRVSQGQSRKMTTTLL